MAQVEADRAEAARAKADAGRGEFVLSGSRSAVDEAEARGQQNLFDQPAEPRQDVVQPAARTKPLDEIEIDHEIDGTGEMVRLDAPTAVARADERIATLSKLIDCLKKG